MLLCLGCLFVWIWTLWFPMCAYRTRKVCTFLQCALSLGKYISVQFTACQSQDTHVVPISTQPGVSQHNPAKLSLCFCVYPKWQFENNLKWISHLKLDCCHELQSRHRVENATCSILSALFTCHAAWKSKHGVFCQFLQTANATRLFLYASLPTASPKICFLLIWVTDKY